MLKVGYLESTAEIYDGSKYEEDNVDWYILCLSYGLCIFGGWVSRLQSQAHELIQIFTNAVCCLALSVHLDPLHRLVAAYCMGYNTPIQ
jgi:hypothetical protein